MKKTIALLTGFICIMGLTACGEDNSSESSVTIIKNETSEQETISENPVTETSESEIISENSDTESTDGKTLVVYYSASGYTEKVAEYIASGTNGDLFEIEPVDIYSDEDLNWTNPDSRVCYEHENPDSRDIELVSTEVADWDSYDTVFIGYPIWWGEAAWVVDNFVKENDFTDKKVIPFCTSASSGLGKSDKLLADMAGTGNWIDGERFRSGVAENDVKAWVNSLVL